MNMNDKFLFCYHYLGSIIVKYNLPPGEEGVMLKNIKELGFIPRQTDAIEFKAMKGSGRIQQYEIGIPELNFFLTTLNNTYPSV